MGDKSESYVGQSSLGRLYSSTPESSQNFFNTVKKVFVSKRKSHLSVFDTRISHSAPTEEVDSGIVSVVDGDSIKHDIHEDSDNVDTDDPLDYISVDEASNINMNVDPEVFAQFMKLHQDISKLKFDKLELLKQNAEAQKQVQELRSREQKLKLDLTMITREISRLRSDVKQRNENTFRCDEIIL